MKKNTLSLFILMAILSLTIISGAFASEVKSLNFGSGPTGKVYTLYFKDIDAVCGQQVPMNENITEGGSDNMRLMSVKQADVGLIDINSYLYEVKKDESAGLIKGVMVLNLNILHPITNGNGVNVGSKCSGVEVKGRCMGTWEPITQRISTISQIKGKGIKVAVVRGVTQTLVERGLNENQGFGLRIVPVNTDAEGYEALKSGQVSVFFTMQAFSTKNTIYGLKNVQGGFNYAILDWDIQPGGFYKVVTKNYPGISRTGNKFLAIPNMLVARPVDPNSAKGQQIVNLRACINRNIATFKEGDEFQQSWADVNNTAVPDGIATFAPGSVSIKSPKKKK
jgi:hypothetical protein